MWQEALLLHMTKRVISPPFVDLKAAPKYGRSHSIPANPSPMGTPQRKAAETHQSQVCRFASLLCPEYLFQFLTLSNGMLFFNFRSLLNYSS